MVVKERDIPIALVPENARELAKLGIQITNEANRQLGFTHPTNPDWKHISFCLFAGEIEEAAEGIYFNDGETVYGGATYSWAF